MITFFRFLPHGLKKGSGLFFRWLRILWNERWSNKAALIVIGLFLLLPIISFIWTPYDYRAQDFSVARQGPSVDHWAGTDLLGRDMFTRMLYAGRITVALGVFFTFLIPVSILAGVVAVFYSRRADFIVQRVGDALDGIPTLFLIIILTATIRVFYDDFLFNLGSVGEWAVRTGIADLILIFFVLSLITWIGPARLYRSMVLDLREAPFVESAKMLGASRSRIVAKHIMPQLYAYVAHSALLTYAGVIGTEIALSFLGIGIRPPHPSFGAMLYESASILLLRSAPHLLIIPGFIISAFIFALYVLDQRLTHLLSSEQLRGGVRK